MPEYFIVTVTDGSFEVDLEIPSRLPFSEFKDKLLDILRIMGCRSIQDRSEYRLMFKNRALGGGDTLAIVGAFDGSLLKIE
jgi:uncharacterized ubiquitin-like protein YukD